MAVVVAALKTAITPLSTDRKRIEKQKKLKLKKVDMIMKTKKSNTDFSNTGKMSFICPSLGSISSLQSQRRCNEWGFVGMDIEMEAKAINMVTIN